MAPVMIGNDGNFYGCVKTCTMMHCFEDLTGETSRVYHQSPH